MADKKTFLVLWIVCIIGSLSVLPYAHSLHILSPDVSIWKISLLTALQSAVLFGLVCWASFKILPKTDLRPFIADHPRKRIVYPALLSGVFVGLVLFFFNKTVFAGSALAGEGIHIPIWAGVLASIYGAVNEEVLLRLFLFTLIYLVLNKVFKCTPNQRLTVLWSANILAALLFGIGHLPSAFKLLGSPSAFEIFRILFLNGIAGIVFGWLYWSRGLWTAIAAHFVADLMIHAVLI